MNHATPPDHTPAVRRFVRATFGLRGTLRLHRAAFGIDLLRAPANVLLAPVFLLTRLLGLAAKGVGWTRLSAWLFDRKILLETNVSRAVAAKVSAFVDSQNITASSDVANLAIADYAGVRSAVAELTTMLLVILTGFAFFHATTFGVISLAGPIAEARALSQAIQNFPLGQGLGRIYYGIFPTSLGAGQVVLTAAVLAVIASVVTTFAGIIADPIQVLTGTHRRRLLRLVDRIERAETPQGLAREHIAARLGDVTDAVISLVRLLRG